MPKAPTIKDDALYSVTLTRTITINSVEFRPSDQNVQMKGHFLKLAQQLHEGAVKDDYAEITE